MIKPYIVLILLVALISANSLQNSFAGDDNMLIIDNPKINLAWGEIPLLFTKSMWNIGLQEHDYQSYYRPIVAVLFVLNYKIWGLNPLGFHLANILLHLIIAIVLYRIGLLLFNNDTFIALMGASIFAVHPVNNEPVGRAASGEVIFGFFIILSVYLFLKEKRVFSWIAFFLALMSKETAVMLPFALMVYAMHEKGFKRGAASAIPYMALTVIYLIIRSRVVDNVFGIREHNTIVVHILTMAAATLDYIRLLIIPYPLSPFYYERLHASIFEPKAALAAILLLSVSFLIFKLRKDKEMLFLLLFPFVMLFPVIFMVNNFAIGRDHMYIAERFLYVPAMMFSLFLSASASKMLKHGLREYLYPGWVFIITVFTIIAIYSNMIWKDDETLNKKIIEKSPEAIAAHNNLGVFYYSRKRMDEAIKEYKTALKIAPDYAAAYYNLGLAYAYNGRLSEAIQEYRTVLRLKPDNAGMHYNLGLVYADNGQLDEAAQEYLTAIKLNHDDFPDAYNNLGGVYSKQGRLDEAAQEYLTAIRLKPDFADAHGNLGNIYFNQGRLDEAVQEYLTAIRLKPDFADVHGNLGNVYYYQGQMDSAIQEYLTAIKLKPGHAASYYNLGITYYDKGWLDRAIQAYMTAIKLKPDHADAHYSLGIAYKAKGLNHEARKEFETALKLKPDDKER